MEKGDRKGERYAGAILMDLSKAFKTINHNLFIAKFHVCGFSVVQVLRHEKSPSCAQTC